MTGEKTEIEAPVEQGQDELRSDEVVSEPSGATSTEVSNADNWFLKVLSGGVFVDASATTMVAPFLPEISRMFNLGQRSLALLLGIRSVTSVVMTIPVGVLIHKWGHQLTLALSFLLSAAACTLLAVPQNWPMLAAGLFLQGICTQSAKSGAASFAVNTFSSAESDWKVAKPGQLVKVFSTVGAMGLIYCWTSMGGVAGPLLGSFLYQYVETWLPFALVGAASIFLSILISCFRLPKVGTMYTLPSSEEGLENVGDAVDIEGGSGSKNYVKLKKLSRNEGPQTYRGLANMDALAMDQDKEETKAEMAIEDVARKHEVLADEKRTLVMVWGAVLRDRVGLAVLLAGCVQSMAWGVYEVVLPYFLTKQCGYRTAQIGIAIGINNGTYAVAAFWAGAVVSRMGSSTSVITGGIILMFTLPLMTIQGLSCHMPLQYAINAASGLGFAFIETPLLAKLAEAMERRGVREHGLLVSVYQFAFSLGYALAPFYCAALFLALVSIGVMGMTAVMLLLCIIFWLVSTRKGLQ